MNKTSSQVVPSGGTINNYLGVSGNIPFNLATGIATIQISGSYLVLCSISVTSNTSPISFLISVNGVISGQAIFRIGMVANSSSSVITFGAIAGLNAGDTIQIINNGTIAVTIPFIGPDASGVNISNVTLSLYKLS
ncbi:hypothetical protein P4412_32480 [Bacillus thuringiensis]|nr:hypothetical protein [Bacillus thuringiensis]